MHDENFVRVKILIILFPVVMIFSCQQLKKNRLHRDVPDNKIVKGKELAAVYCQSCHMLPDPMQLDAKTWEEGVLPGMGPRFGIFYYDSKEYPSSKYDPNVDKSFYPALPVITFDDWQCIIDYYSSMSPDSLSLPGRNQMIEDGSSLFHVELPKPGRSEPTTCLVKIDSSVTPVRIFIGDMETNQLTQYSTQRIQDIPGFTSGKTLHPDKTMQYDSQFRVFDSIRMISPVVDMEIHARQIITCNVGVMNPNNGKYGTAGQLTIGPDNKMKQDSVLGFVKMMRPVQLRSADLNGDGNTDYLVCEFGHLAGALTWMENKGNNAFERHVLRAYPGAIKAYVRDLNNDKLPDILALFSQGDEGIYAFINKGHGEFEQQLIMRFPPINGSSYFELADFNKDGFPDILYTCGDNADYSPVLKPYHGIYIFINNGKNQFTRKCFLPMYGCFKAMARDFDGDGILDIAAISFFADYAGHPEESFFYFQGAANLQFQAFTVPGTSAGRWLTMDTGDVDGDGKEDIVLGNFSLAPPTVKSAPAWKNGPPFILLKNIMKRK